MRRSHRVPPILCAVGLALLIGAGKLGGIESLAGSFLGGSGGALVFCAILFGWRPPRPGTPMPVSVAIALIVIPLVPIAYQRSFYPAGLVFLGWWAAILALVKTVRFTVES